MRQTLPLLLILLSPLFAQGAISDEEALDVLSSKEHRYWFGNHCGYAGTQPLGRKSINHLVEAERYDLVGKVFEGDNNEGKAYALEAIVANAEAAKKSLTAEQFRAAEDFIQENPSIETCNGCLVMNSTLTKDLILSIIVKQYVKRF